MRKAVPISRPSDCQAKKPPKAMNSAPQAALTGSMESLFMEFPRSGSLAAMLFPRDLRRPSSPCRALLPVKDGEKKLGRGFGDLPLPVLHGERVRVRGVLSVGVLAGGVDDRLPTRDLAFHLGLQRFGRGVGFRRRSGAEFGEAGDDVGVLQRQLQRLRQPRGDNLTHA